MANFKNLISYFGTSLCADQKSYKNLDDPKLIYKESLHLKVMRNRQIFAFIIHQSILYELLSNLIGSLLLYYDFILH